MNNVEELELLRKKIIRKEIFIVASVSAQP